MDNIPKRLRKLRLDKKLTQDDLAQQLHVTRQAVSNWETGKTVVGIEYLMQLSGIYGISVDELLHGERAAEPEVYPQNQRKYFACAVICIGILLVCALLNVTVKPRLMKLYNEFVALPLFWYRQIVSGAVAAAVGVLLPAAVSLHKDIRLWGRWRRLAVVMAVLWLVPVALGFLQFMGWLPYQADTVWGGVVWFVSEIWWEQKFYRELFFLSGGCFFLGLNR